jgi:cysteinyl-tRNA synthetase
MSGLQLKNSYTKSIEPFEPLDPENKSVSMYSCGPTVYSYQHIGNFRSFLVADLLRRVLELHGYAVRHVMNITDVGHMTEDHLADASGEDKLSKAARELGSDPYTVANHFARAFAEDAVRLRIKIYRGREADDPSIHPRATRHVPEMLSMIQALLDRGYAYIDSQGQVYFAIDKFADYGRLSGKVIDELEAGARVAVRDEKRDARDFALWKVDEKHLMQWDPHGSRGWAPEDFERLGRLVPGGVAAGLAPGFPGWHIECSAMSSAHLGRQIDIHTGGEDNAFPHHECEIAQTFGAFGTGTPPTPGASSQSTESPSFARYWVHGRHLLANGRKMSKREGTLFTVRDILEPREGKRPDVVARFEAVGLTEGCVSGEVLRYALMSNPYTQPMNFTFDLLVQAKASVERLQSCYDRLRELGASSGGPATMTDDVTSLALGARREFLEALDDNLNTPNALSAVFSAITGINQMSLDAVSAGPLIELLEYFDAVLDVLDRRVLSAVVTFEEIAAASLPGQSESLEGMTLDAPTIRSWIALRHVAKKAREFSRSDEIRDGLRARGVLIEDVAVGVRWKLKT